MIKSKETIKSYYLWVKFDIEVTILEDRHKKRMEKIGIKEW
jgi:hypothetical protein